LEERCSRLYVDSYPVLSLRRSRRMQTRSARRDRVIAELKARRPAGLQACRLPRRCLADSSGDGAVTVVGDARGAVADRVAVDRADAATYRLAAVDDTDPGVCLSVWVVGP